MGDERTTWGLDDLEALQGHWPLEIGERLVPLSDLRVALSRAEAAEWDNRRLREALKQIDPEKLRLLAQWHDLHDEQTGRTGIEVQMALRRWADAVDAALAAPPEGATREEQT